MKAHDLKTFKGRIREFKNVIDALSKIWDNPKYITISILLQNLGFEGVRCENYSLEKDLVKCNNIIKALELLSSYDTNCHLTQYVYQEVSAMFQGYSYED